MSSKNATASLKKLTLSTTHVLSSSQVITSVHSVVKELIENSLDASATSIDIKLVDCGLAKLEIRDNGVGVSAADVLVMAKPHYTSKLSNEDDITSCTTYGFRGEALSALCSVADISVTTKTAETDVSITYTFDSSGTVINQRPSPLGQGTTVRCQNLLKNLPVRKKIWNSAKHKKEDFKKCEDLIKIFSVIHPEVRFSLSNENCLVWQKTSVSDVRASLVQAWGISLLQQMEEHTITDHRAEIQLTAFLPRKSANWQTISKKSSDACWIVVNKKPVKQQDIIKVLNSGFGNHWGSQAKGRYPLCFLHFTLAPQKVDVNLEPNKDKVFFHCKESVLNLVSRLTEEAYGNDQENMTNHGLLNGDEEELIGGKVSNVFSDSREIEANLHDTSKSEKIRDCNEDSVANCVNGKVQKIDVLHASDDDNNTVRSVSKSTDNSCLSLIDSFNHEDDDDFLQIPDYSIMTQNTRNNSESQDSGLNNCINNLNNIDLRPASLHSASLKEMNEPIQSGTEYLNPCTVSTEIVDEEFRIPAGERNKLLEDDGSLLSIQINSNLDNSDTANRIKTSTNQLSISCSNHDNTSSNLTSHISDNSINNKDNNNKRNNNFTSIISKSSDNQNSNRSSSRDSHGTFITINDESKQVQTRTHNENTTGTSIDNQRAEALPKQPSEKWSLGQLRNQNDETIQPVKMISGERTLPEKRPLQTSPANRAKKLKVDKRQTKLDDLIASQTVKKPKSPFAYFCKDHRAEVVKANPEGRLSQITDILVDMFDKLDPAKKEAYKSMAEKNVSCSKKPLNKEAVPERQSNTTANIKDPKEKRKELSVYFDLSILKKFCRTPAESVEMPNIYLIGQLEGSGSWVGFKDGNKIVAINHFRMKEALIYQKLKSTYELRAQPVLTPTVVDERSFGSKELFQTLLHLPAEKSSYTSHLHITDSRITLNGFKINKSPDSNRVEITECNQDLPYYGLSDLKEILQNIHSGYKALALCRPRKVLHFLQGETVRMVRQTPSKLTESEMKSLLESVLALPENCRVCAHNKSFIHVIQHANVT